MENIKEIIAKNLVELRKSRKLTQQDLAQKLNYSDKAISRWEHAEALPDIETLSKVCDVYGVKFEYLLQKEQPKKNNPYVNKNDIASRVIITFIAVLSVWIAALVAFTYINTILKEVAWTLFIWALPVTAVVCNVCNKLFFQNRTFKYISNSAFMWTLLLSIYLQIIEYNIWMLFIIGVPIQIVIILTGILKAKSRR
jgi:transcriptional regulator with XRE-family HTH domain